MLPTWPEARALLPEPIWHEADALDAYWDAWRRTITDVTTPGAGSGLPAPFIALNFDGCIYAHDTTAMMAYAMYGHRVHRWLDALDNFYAKQHDTGEICRQIHADTGRDAWPNATGELQRVVVGDPWEKGTTDFAGAAQYTWTRPRRAAQSPPPRVTIDGMNDPCCFALAEWEYFQLTADASRLLEAYRVNLQLFQAFLDYRTDTNGFFVTDWASMDNSPRNLQLGYGVDLACQVVVLGDLLDAMAGVLGLREHAQPVRDQVMDLRTLIQRAMWCPATGMFHCLDRSSAIIPIKTVAGFMPLLAQACLPEQTESLVAHLRNPRTFGTPLRVPTLSADESQFVPGGHYYWGGVWSFTNHPVIRGLEQCGKRALARAIGRDHWRKTVDTHRETGTFWEYLDPIDGRPGRSANVLDPGKHARRDFAGFGVLPAIAYFLEYGIGLRPDGPNRILHWHIDDCLEERGCRRYAFGGITTDLICHKRHGPGEPPRISARTDAPYLLRVTTSAGLAMHLQVDRESVQLVSTANLTQE